MRLSTKGRYAVMAMADLAKNGRGEGGEIRAVSLAEIAASVLRKIGHRHDGVSSLGRQTHFAPSKIARFPGLLC